MSEQLQTKGTGAAFLKLFRSLRRSSVAGVAAGDLISKILLVGVNLYLIRRLEITEYSHFAMLLNAIFLAYQLACGPIERLYIADHERFRGYMRPLGVILCMASLFACISWLLNKIAISDAILILIGTLLLAHYQIMRIKLQQKMEFSLFALSDIIKNALWLALVGIIIWIPGIPLGTSALICLLVATLLSTVVLSKSTMKRIPQFPSRGTYGHLFRLLWETRFVILYSLAGALIPYMPILMAAKSGSDVVIATYGAALRYQAILGMAVFAFNAVLLPKLAAYGHDTEGRELFMLRMKRMLPIGVLLFICTVLSVWLVIPYIDGGKYPMLPAIFLIISLTPALSLASAPYINILLLDGRAREVFYCMMIGLAASVCGYVFFQSSKDGTWVAWVSLVTYFLIAAGSITCVRTMKRNS